MQGPFPESKDPPANSAAENLAPTARQSRVDQKARENAESAQQRWQDMMRSTHVSAQEAWDSGRTHYVLVTRLEYADGSPPDDVAGMLQVLTTIGWKLFETDLASAVRVVIPGGMVGWGGVGVLGTDQYASDLIAVYTFERPEDDG